jgi:hypothetical protein
MGLIRGQYEAKQVQGERTTYHHRPGSCFSTEPSCAVQLPLHFLEWLSLQSAFAAPGPTGRRLPARGRLAAPLLHAARPRHRLL